MADPTQSRIEVLSKDFKRDNNDTVLCTDRVRIKFDGVTLDLAQSWENGEEMAPIFSGACWAGTVVWQAALDLCDYMSEHLRRELVGATVVELGCGIGVPGMVARLLGATVVLTEQDELLSLLDRNLANNFPQDKGIRKMALDWERRADTDAILASLLASKSCSSSRVGADVHGSAATEASEESFSHGGKAIEERDGAGGGARLEMSADGGTQHVAVGARSGDAGEDGEGGAGAGSPTHLEFVLCADCVFEPLYGDSWKALAKVMGRLSDSGTTVLCSVERRGDDGVPRFLDACAAEGFSRRMVYRSAPEASAPIELYELSKGGEARMRGVAADSHDT